MKRRFLEDCLAKGMSLEAIGELTGRHPSTVGYWLKKHGLSSGGVRQHAARGALEKAQLEDLIKADLTLREIAERLDRSMTTVRYWLDRHEIDNPHPSGPRPRAGGGAKTAIFRCRRHGMTEFSLEGRGHYRCKRCRSAAVVKRRRKVKLKLVEEAGGQCALCGYGRYVGALQFHHFDPNLKAFSVTVAATAGRSLAVGRR
jgi:transposase